MGSRKIKQAKNIDLWHEYTALHTNLLSNCQEEGFQISWRHRIAGWSDALNAVKHTLQEQIRYQRFRIERCRRGPLTLFHAK